MLNVGGNDLIELATSHLQASGFVVLPQGQIESLIEQMVADRLKSVEAPQPKVTKARKTRAKAEAPKLNAVGKPYGANFNPNHRMKYKTPAAKYGPSTAASIKDMDNMRDHIKSYWTAKPKLAKAA